MWKKITDIFHDLVYDDDTDHISLTDTIVLATFILWGIVFIGVTYQVFYGGQVDWKLYLIYVMIYVFTIILKYGKMNNFTKALGDTSVPIVKDLGKVINSIVEKDDVKNG